MTSTDLQAVFDNLSDGSSGNSSTKATVSGTLSGWSTSNFGPNTLFTRSITGQSSNHITGAISIIPGTDAVLPVTGVKEISTVNFGQLARGDSITVAGITVTALNFMTANELAHIYSSLSDGSSGSSNPNANVSGSLTGFSTALVSGTSVQFTCSTPGPSVSSTITYSIAPPVRTSITKISDVVASINSISGETGVYASDNGSGITLTAPDGRNISLATGTDPATNTLTFENLGLGPSTTALANQQYPALKINGGPQGAITTYSTVILNSDKSFTMSGGAKDTSLADLNLLGFRENTYGGSNDGIKIAYVDISTVDGANDALAAVENAISQISDIRSNLGAVQNKLLSAIENLTSSQTNAQQSSARISDTDYGISTTELARTQIINQAATAMLAQANQQTQLVMQLLKNNG
jgi:flagellin